MEREIEKCKEEEMLTSQWQNKSPDCEPCTCGEMCSPAVREKLRKLCHLCKSTLVNKPCLKEHYLEVLDPWFWETLVGDTEQDSIMVEMLLTKS